MSHPYRQSTPPPGDLTYTYDAGNRITQGSGNWGQRTIDTYNSKDRLATRNDALLNTETFTYDNANRLTQIQPGASTVMITYDTADRRISVTYPNTNKMEYAYNSASELTTVTYKQGTTTLGTLTYIYDAAGNRIKTGGTFARTNVPPTLTSATNNANNQQTVFGTATETYDLNGNLATFTDASGTTTYTWNARNQLTGISKTGFTASFTYDSFGRRTGRTVNGVVTNYVYDGLNPVQEKNGATVTANLLTGLGIDEFFTRTDGVGVRSLLPDALGSTVALGDGTGTLQTEYTYEPFGLTTQTGSANTNSYKFTGREDDGSGLYYYRARYYQPRLQRFIAEDPIGFEAGDMNVYAYVRNNPINLTDPLGLKPASCGCPSSDFKTTFANNLLTTNDFFFGFPWNFTRTGLGLLVGSSTTISNTVGTVTLGQALKSVVLQGQGVANLTIPNTLVSGAVNSALGALAVGVSLEAGIITGSAIDAGVKSLHDLAFGCD